MRALVGVTFLQGPQQTCALSGKITNSGSLTSTFTKMQEVVNLLPDIGIVFVQGNELSERNED